MFSSGFDFFQNGMYNVSYQYADCVNDAWENDRRIPIRSVPTCENESSKEKIMKNMQDVCTFIKEARTYFIATVEGDQPRVRPFGTIHVYQGRLYIQTGKRKDFSRQLAVNPKAELCAFNGKEWLRLSGTLVNDDSLEAKESMLEQYPELKSMYSATDDNTQVLYFKDATAILYSFGNAPVTVKF